MSTESFSSVPVDVPAPTTPALSREAILQSFLQDAEAATQQLIAFSHLLDEFNRLRTELVEVYGKLTAAHREAMTSELARTKFAELGMESPDKLEVVLRPTAKRGRPRKDSGKPRRAATPKAAAPAPAAAGVGAEGSSGSGQGVPFPPQDQ